MEHNHDGHRQRLRERFEKTGIEGFEWHVILESILFYSISRGDTNAIAHDLINTFGSFSAVLEASQKDLMKVAGVGEKTATMLRMIPGITRKYLEDKNSFGNILDSSKKLGEFLMPRFIGRNNETLFVLTLDNKCKMLSCNLISEGTLDFVNVDVRKIVEVALRVPTSGLVLAHNHTQGFALPSQADKSATITIKKILKPMAIELLDHIIVSGDDFVSMADSGIFVE